MNQNRDRWIVSTDWLKEHLSAPDIVILDASWHMPDSDRDAHKEYLEGHIPGALFFDIDDIADKTDPLPHMLPGPVMFSSRMRKMGIGDGNRVVVYDSHGLMTAARVWWTFRVMGHNDVAILDGGLPKWRAEGGTIETGPPPPRQERHFTSRRQTTMVCSQDDTADMSRSGIGTIIDARSAGRFAGDEPEPREGLRSGHIPASINVPYKDLLNDDGTLRKTEEIRAAFARSGNNLAGPIITTCGSGVTAAVLALGLEILGHKQIALYDGSWTDWGAATDLPIETGAPNRNGPDPS